jgi:hypothetical protein
MAEGFEAEWRGGEYTSREQALEALDDGTGLHGRASQRVRSAVIHVERPMTPEVVHLSELASKVKRQREDAALAFTDERSATAATWLAVMEAIKPALPYLAGPGSVVILLREGINTLALRWDGRLEEIKDTHMVAIESPDIFKRWPLPRVIAALSEVLEKQTAGNLEFRTRQARTRAAKLRAALKVLRD